MGRKAIRMQNQVLAWSLLSVLAGCTAVTSFGDYEVVEDGGAADGTTMDGTTGDAGPPPEDAGPPPEDGGPDAPGEDTGPPPMDGGVDAGDDAGTSLCGTTPECTAGMANVACTTSCGTMGMGTCTAECRAPSGDACVPPAEICDGIDNNCDGVVDEGVTWRHQTRVMSEIGREANIFDARVVNTPNGLVALWAGRPPVNFAGNDERIEYHISRLGDDGMLDGTPVRITGFEGDSDEDLIQIKGFAATNVGNDVFVAFRNTVTGLGLQMVRYHIPVSTSSPPTLDGRRLFLPVPTRGTDFTWMASTDDYAVVVAGPSFGADYQLFVVALRGDDLVVVDEAMTVRPGSRPFVFGGRAYVAVDRGSDIQINILSVDVGTDSVRLTPIGASTIDLSAISTVLGGDEGALVVTADSSSTSALEVLPPDYDCTDCSPTALASQRFSWGVHSGGRWVLASYNAATDQLALGGFAEGDLSRLVFDLSRASPDNWGSISFVEDDGDFVMLNATRQTGIRRLYHTRYTCLP